MCQNLVNNFLILIIIYSLSKDLITDPTYPQLMTLGHVGLVSNHICLTMSQ